MLGVEGYGSDSDSENETKKVTTTPLPKSTPIAPKPAGKAGLSLPPPSNTIPRASSSSLTLPPPKKKAPKKITIGLPSLPNEPSNDDDVDERPPPKKPRLEAGVGSSTLLSMLPAPKNKNPVSQQPERVLGAGRGPGLVFHTGSNRTKSTQSATVEDADEDESEDVARNVAPVSGGLLEEAEDMPVAKSEKAGPSIPFLPPHLRKGKANISTEDKPSLPKSAAAVSSAPAVDFFSLGSASSSSSPTPVTRSATPTPSASIPFIPTPSLPSVSSAPKIDDFAPPEPTPQDPYPGYYLLPSGQWAAYDPAYYKKFYDKWKKEYDAHVRALEKGVEKGFEGIETEGAAEVNAFEEMEKAKHEIQEREEKKALTKGGQHVQVAPRMNIKGAALSGRARSRHQLSTLLTEAYGNREALEEKIAQGRKNRKEAGNKYGF
ncbi:uncharacterized protein PHACADRAFT_184398 [Phanerochaete carnosa HHB-10118-sp]|uniref:Mitotic checkpoint regulator, MAD2B-interacting-domain-containing protein n=1 Tax=Phanerochaete carnosa (strain HHB-10118-sp) TaxID=650164 RepID=K5UZL0_PHACS|nr:uncharacterized protein PHACADRAFT_184398 [Phanerochaete carnosa HHB-10118-sp]EKM55616.1 hypothetical protein PHACADRAFT_184398 [Phanerochaete carnosa HHB-10118-sp]